MIPSNICTGVSLRNFMPTHHLFVYASLRGCEEHMDQLTLPGVSTEEQAGLHINSRVLGCNSGSETSHPCADIQDNATVHINKMGSTHSSHLLDRTFHQFYELKEVRARHIPGITNVVADALSRPHQSTPTEWQLQPNQFWMVCHHLTMPIVFVSPLPDPLAWDQDSLVISWENLHLHAYTFPQPAVVPRVL